MDWFICEIEYGLGYLCVFIISDGNPDLDQILKGCPQSRYKRNIKNGFGYQSEHWTVLYFCYDLRRAI